MLKKILTISVVVLLLNLTMVPSVLASANAEKKAKMAEKVKIGIAKLGVGTESKVKLKLNDGTKVKGYISEISAEQFVVVDSRTGESVTVSYSSVKQVKGNNLSKQAYIVIGFIGFIALLVIILVAQKENT